MSSTIPGIRYSRAARGLEAGGYYGAAKLLQALAYAEEVKAINEAAMPRGEALTAELRMILAELQATGANPAVIAALEGGLQMVLADSTIPYHIILAVSVSRTSGEVFIGEPPEFSENHDHRLGLRAFSPVWYFDALSPAECLAALSDNPAMIEAQFSGLSTEQCAIPSAPGEWSMRELVWHLFQAQQLLAERIERLLTEDNPSLEPRAVWTIQAGAALSISEIWEQYRASRSEVLERLHGIPSEDWWRQGWHLEFGPQTVLSQATYFARHEVSHMPQFADIRHHL